ncbi:DUF4097 domain-containing protein [Pontibacillus salicampi]|uniref:DUF4097 domain-containing protein n=1 Tax=Pontibacillus salicampi TaxID=1449801 RepID=A0ABV6LT99_9BACI
MNEERQRILKLLEQGMINSEEAEELLDAITHAEDMKEQEPKEDDVHALSTKVDWKANEQQSYKTGSNKKRFMEFVEDTITKIKNVDLDFNFGSYYEVSHIFQNQGVSFSKVHLDIANGSLEVRPWGEDDLRIECKAKVYQAKHQDDARKRFMELKKYNVDDEALSFAISSKKVKTNVVLYIPNKWYDDISLRLFNGPIQVEQLKTKEFHAKTANGKLELAHLDGREIEVETSNGAITLQNVNATDVEAESINGSITIDGRYHKVDAQCVNGNIKCYWGGDEGHTGYYKTTTGNISVHVPPERHIEGKLHTSIGNIHCTLPDFQIEEEKKEVLRKELIFQSRAEQGNPLHIDAETKTGVVTIQSNHS